MAIAAAALMAAAVAAQLHEWPLGGYIVRANVANADLLPGEVLRKHNLDPASEVLNVVVLDRGELPRDTVHARVTATVTDLSGHVRDIPMREVIDRDRVSYLGEIPVASIRTRLDIAIAVRVPDGNSSVFRFRDMHFGAREAP